MYDVVCGRQTEGPAMRCGLLKQHACGPDGIADRKAYPVQASQALPSFLEVDII